MKISCRAVGEYQANCYVLQEEESGRALVIDPGAEAEALIGWIRTLEAQPEAILITHGHFDHLGAAYALSRQYQAPIYMHPDEVLYMQDRSHPLMRMTEGMLDELLAALPQNGRYVCDGDVLRVAGEPLQILEVPGHSDHSLCVYSAKEAALFCGDTLFAGSIGRTDLYHGSDQDLVQNIVKKFGPLPEETVVYTGHGPSTTLQQEWRTNPFIRRR